MPTAERQLATFIDKFDAANQKLIRSVRSAMRKKYPTAHELVYDNYNFFVIGYSPTERPSDAIFSIAAQAKGVSLCFIHGAKLKDPEKRLHGAGKQTRALGLATAAVLAEPAVAALMSQAVANSPSPLNPKAKGQLIIRSVSAKQRPRKKA